MIKHMGWLLLLTLAACEVHVSGDEVKGSGKLAVEKREVGAFSAIEMSGSFDLIVTGEGGPSVEVSGDDNLVNQITTVVSGDTLVIGRKKHRGIQIGVGGSDFPLTVKVSAAKLVRLKNAGSGDVSVDKYRGDKLELINEGPGDMRLAGTVGALILKSNGSGDVDLRQLSAASVNARMSASGDTLIGSVSQDLNIETSGSGDITGQDIKLAQVSAVMRGAGDVSWRCGPNAAGARPRCGQNRAWAASPGC